jgi:hypothetical protein
VSNSGEETPGKITQGGMRGWPGKEWKKLPVGVQVTAKETLNKQPNGGDL